ncbi:hypothetical protein HMPREF1199_01888, partial [Hoylesella oralis CC98A]
STSVVHRVNLRGSSRQPPWFMLSTSVVHDVNLRGLTVEKGMYKLIMGYE